MLCVTLQGYTRDCAAVTGGVSRVWAFDPEDFNFTQVAATPPAGANPYTVIARRAGATTTALMYPIVFEDEQAGYDTTHSLNGSSNVWAHKLEMQLPQLSQALTNFLISMQVGGVCCGIGFIIELNDGKVFAVGEKYVNTNPIPKWKMKQNGTTQNTGKTFSEFNGANVIFTGNYSRPAFEFTAGTAAIVALQTYTAP